MKYEWNGNVLTIDNEQGEKLSLDLDQLSDAVKDGAMKLGLRTALRNSTAGKMDDEAEGWKALKAKAAVFSSGVWEKAGEAKAKVELTEAEQLAVVSEILIQARRAQGDKRTDQEILEAFNGLEEARQAEILTALKKAIDKRMAAKLREKKGLAKATGVKVEF